MQIYYSDGKMMKTVNVSNFTGSYVLINLTPSTQYSVHVITVRFIEETNEILNGYMSGTATATTLGKVLYSGYSYTALTMRQLKFNVKNLIYVYTKHIVV